MKDERTFAQIFPRLIFAGAAGAFLRKCSGNNISWQLRERRISRVQIVPLLMSNGGLAIGDDGEFLISLDDTDCPRDHAKSLGHEIAHTFHHNLTQHPPRNFLPDNLRDEVENFCTAFAVLWLQRNSIDEVVRRIQNESTLITHCHTVEH